MDNPNAPQASRALSGITILDRLVGDDTAPGLWPGQTVAIEHGASNLSTERLFARLARAYATHPESRGTMIVVDTNALLHELAGEGIVPKLTHRLAPGFVAFVCMAAEPGWQKGFDTVIMHADREDFQNYARLTSVVAHIRREGRPGELVVPSVVLAPGTLTPGELYNLRHMGAGRDFVRPMTYATVIVGEHVDLGELRHAGEITAHEAHEADVRVRSEGGRLTVMAHRRVSTYRSEAVDFASDPLAG